MSMLESLSYFKPELTLTGLLLFLFIVDLFRKPKGKTTMLTFISLAGLVGTTMILLQSAGENAVIFQNQYSVDPFAVIFKIIFLVCGGIITLVMFQSTEVDRENMGEFLTIMLSLILGLFLLVSSLSLLMLYLALEFVSITSYVLTGFKRNDQRTCEAALKYVIYGGVVSGVMLFGMSYLYGLFGTLEIPLLKQGLMTLVSEPSGASRVTVLTASIFIFAGFGYKMSAVPFHMWCPDVYEGAPTPFTAFLSVAPKIAGIAVFCRFLLDGFVQDLDSFLMVFDVPWAAILGIVAVATMTLGNLSAISQRNIKRLLAYSGIAHCGYILMGLSALTREGMFAFLFYAVVYMIMNLGAFVVVIAVREKTGREDIDAYRGLGYREPFMAAALSVFLLSLTGIPPLAGFIAKFYVFAAIIHKAQKWYYILALAGIVNSVISLYYYAGIIRVMYFEKSEEAYPAPVQALQKAVALLLLIPVFILGVYWQPLTQKIDFSTATTDIISADRPSQEKKTE